MRTAQTIEANNADRTPQETPPKKDRNRNPNWRDNLIAPWKRGQSGNPGGRPKNDLAQEIAQAIFTENPEVIYQAYAAALQGGNAYAFQVIADRAFGKMKETKVLEGAEGGPIQQSIEVRFIEADAK